MSTLDGDDPSRSARNSGQEEEVASLRATGETVGDSPKARSEDDGTSTRKAGRGFLVITAAKAWFMVAASILNFGLPLLFARPADYGTYGVVINAVSLLNMVVITSSLQATSKLVSESPGSAQRVVRTSLLLQLVVGIPLAGLWYLAAEPVAAWLRDPAYAHLLRISALIVAAYSFYAVFVGALNGVAAFTRQAVLDIAFATLRAACILGAVGIGAGVAGAIWGFAGAAVTILVVSAAWVTRYLGTRDPFADGRAGATSRATGLRDAVTERPDWRRLAAFLVSIMVYTFALNLLMRVDLFALKRFSAGVAGPDALVAAASNATAGAYALAVNIARVPYQAVIAVAFVIFPMLSRSAFAARDDETRAWIRTTMRYSLLMIAWLASVLAGAGADLVRPLYPDYAFAASALPALCVAYACFALFYVLTTMLIAAGHPWLATFLTALTTALLAFATWLFVRDSAPGVAMVEATAVTLLVTVALGFALAGLCTWRLYGAFVPLRSALRIGLVAGVVMVVGEWSSFDRWMAFADAAPRLQASGVGEITRDMVGSRTWWALAGIGKAVALGVLWLVLLAVSGEVGPRDRERLRAVVRRRRRPQHDAKG